MIPIRLENLSKHFGLTRAVDAVSLSIAAGELFFLLGPSGCGKSTLLRMIAGLELPSSGKIFFADRDVTTVPTEQRNAVMCFQSYALWPHMTVAENVRFGLKVRNESEQAARVREALALVRMTDYAARKPNQLSGGQQQRVALARALAVRPDCLLLDEPLSNLDAKLRSEMRTEIRRICKTANLTAVYVTHDQKEALSTADRIGVMREGKMIQIGTPAELYYAPVNSFVAEFIGATNLIRGTVAGSENGAFAIDTPIGRILAKKPDRDVGRDVLLSLRPEQLRMSNDAAAPNRLLGKVLESTFLGESSEHVLAVNDQRIKVIATPPKLGAVGEMAVSFYPADVVVLQE